jgi:acyl-CoA thioester hydrolase
VWFVFFVVSNGIVAAVVVDARHFRPLRLDNPGLSVRLARMSESVFRWDYRVSYADCTLGNHVFYSRYLDVLERARGEFFRHIGRPLADLQEADTTFPVLECHLKYHAPARYDDLLTIEVSVTGAKGVRLNFHHRILARSSSCLVECETFQVCASIAGKPKRLPRELMALLGPYLPAVDSD